MFKSPGRQVLNDMKDREILQLPGFEKYSPKREFIMSHKYAGGIKIPKMKKDTTKGLV